MKKNKIGIKFCGHCSPKRDMAKLAKQLMQENEEYVFVYYAQDRDVDLLLNMNACDRGCVGNIVPDIPNIIVTPGRINGSSIEEDKLSEEISKAIGKYGI